MSQEECVSVIIPTYYRNESLERAIESVNNQTHSVVETIVVDDSGEAHAEPVVSKYDILYVPLSENRGPHNARRVGVERASGTYVQFLDDDDYLHPEKFEKQIESLRSNEEAEVTYCGQQAISTGIAVYPDRDVKGCVLEEALRFQTSPCNTGTLFMERDIVEEILPFKHVHGADDIGMKIELARKTKFDYVDEILFYRGYSDDSMSRTQQAVDGRWKIIDMYEDLYDEFSLDVRRAAVAETWMMQGEVLLRNHRWSLDAIVANAKACYYVSGIPFPYLGSFIGSLLGREGYFFLRSKYSRLVLGYDRRGKGI